MSMARTSLIDPAELTQAIKAQAAVLGFSLVGVCPAVGPSGLAQLDQWLAAGYAGQMHYLAARRAAYDHPRHVLEGVRSLVMLGLPYHTAAPLAPAVGQGRVSCYAWGTADYHDVIHDKLRHLAQTVRQHAPQAQVRGVVDTAPLLEREFAQLAGLGWIGKNTLLLNKPAGSYFFLAALLTDQELAYDAPYDADHCGSCQACLQACPTQALVQPYVLDATRCISYLTIELRGPIPRELRPGVGDWLFGCDVCQEVCPWNRRAVPSPEAGFQPQPGHNPLELAGLFFLDETAFRQRFRHTPLWRARRRGILRNAAIVLGNQRAVSALPALCRGLDDPEPLVRGAAAWALGRLPTPQAEAALRRRAALESDPQVREELASALAEWAAALAPTSAALPQETRAAEPQSSSQEASLPACNRASG
jgi:epoxyqueuosine reductase